MHQNPQLLSKKYAQPYFKPGLRILEIGPNAMRSAFQRLLKDDSLVCHTLDLSFRNDIPLNLQSGRRVRIPNRRQQLRDCPGIQRHQACLEDLALDAGSRASGPGGHVITIAPVTWEYHEDPVDCWRIYPEGMKALSEDAGLKGIVCEWEALGITRLRRIGGSKQLWEKLGGLLNLLHWKLKLQCEAAFDTMTIAQKL